MFRKLDQWLLTRHPLLWNMRVHLIVPVIILAHIAFYAAGYLNPITLQTLDHYYYISHDDGVQALASLLAVLILIVWLVFYFRNNAFKSFYPQKKGSVFAEYLILVIIVLGACTFAMSWGAGFRNHVRVMTRSTDLKKEAEITNLAMHFIPFSKDDFAIEGCCDTLRKYADSPNYGRARNIEEDTLPEYHSYLYYCDLETGALLTEQVSDKFAVNETAHRWLMQHKQDSVKWVMDEYLKLCDKYNAVYQFNTENESKACFKTADFRVQHYIGEDNYGAGRAYIEKKDVSNSLERIDEVRDPSQNYRQLIGILYLSICLALAILSFRITRLRTWFIAAVGSGLWAMLFGLGAAFTRGSSLFAMFMYMILAIAFIGYATVNILRKKNKSFAGFSFLRFTWMLPALVPLFFTFLERAVFREDMYVYDQAGNAEYIGPHPVYLWINDHWGLINACNMVFVVLMIAWVLIPLARRWQANPEE